MDLPALLEAAGVYDKRFPLCVNRTDSIITLHTKQPDPYVTGYELRYDIPASANHQTCHVVQLTREADVITRFESLNAHVVLVVNDLEVADLTKKCVIPVVGILCYYPITLHLYPLNRDQPMCLSALGVIFARDRREIAVSRHLLCGSFSVHGGLIDSRD